MYSANLIVNSPVMAGVFRCKDCHMNFQSQPLLTKHKSKFCVGSTTDPDDLQLRRGLRSSSPPRFQSPDDRDDYRRNPNSDQQLRSLAENHGRQMEYLQLQNRDLEKQREDIRKRLEGLGRRTVVQPQDNSADLLRELREQEVRNQRALDDLRRQLQGMNTEPKINVIEVEKPVYQPPPPPPPAPEPKKPIVFPVYYGKSLVAEISAIRQAYLQNGGNDPDVLAQMAQMQAEAQAIEDQMNQKPEPKPKEKPKDNNAAFRMLEMENEKLIQELRLLQEQNSLAQNRRRSDKEGKKRSHGQSHDRKYSHSHFPTISPPKPVFSDRKTNTYKQRPNWQARQFAADIRENPSYRALQQPTSEYGDTDRRKPVRDDRSYRSEPVKKPKEKVIKYIASHQADGSVHIRRGSPDLNSLNMLDLSAAYGHRGSRPDKENRHMGDMHSSFRRAPKYKPLSSHEPSEVKPDNPYQSMMFPAKTKLSHVSEALEPQQSSRAPPSRSQLPPLNSEYQRIMSPEKPMSRHPSLHGGSQRSVHGSQRSVYEESQPQGLMGGGVYTRPPSQASIRQAPSPVVPPLQLNDDDQGYPIEDNGQNDMPEGYMGINTMDDGTKDVAWQVARRSTPPPSILETYPDGSTFRHEY